MAQFIIDPVGEFARNARGKFGTERFHLNLLEIYNNLGKEVRVYNVRDLVLDTWELFEKVLYKVDFLKKLSIDAAQNRQKACKLIRQEIEGKITLTNLWTEESFAKVIDLLRNEDIQTQIFKGKNERGRLNHFVNTINRQQMYTNFWQPVLTLFRESKKEGRINISELTKQVFDLHRDGRPIIVIDLSLREETALEWDDDIEKLVVKRLFQQIYIDAKGLYQEEKSLNCLVMLDEAHRFANKEVDSSKEKSASEEKKGIVGL
jgi:DNA helicase HerA-like ATPase